MASYRLTAAERRLLREQSGLNRIDTGNRALLALTACAMLGGIALAAWGAHLAASGIALLPGM